jgi:protoheme IX farnesyltransferase
MVYDCGRWKDCGNILGPSVSNHVMDYWRLVRPRIVALVLLAMAVSAWIAAPSWGSWPEIARGLAGAALVIVGAVALNQRLEWRHDAQMARTASRPLPAGRLSRRQVAYFGLAMTVVGLLYLAVATSAMLAVLAAIGWIVYVGLYTPMKTRSTWQTPIGAAAGAMPVLLGAAAVGRWSNPWAWLLFAIVYLWQFPHSMAIAWRYREEFAAAGVKVAPATEPSGRTAGIWAVLGAALLLPISLVPVCLGLAGVTYGVAALLLGLAYLALSLRFARRRDDATARVLLLASLVYLPAILAAALFL